MLHIAYREVRRATNRHRNWLHFRDDLVQDAAEGMVQGLARRPDAGGGYLRLCARGAIVRAALGYLGVTEKTGWTPHFTGEEAAETRGVEPEVVARVEVASVVNFAFAVGTLRQRAIMQGLMDEKTVTDIAAGVGMSRQTVYTQLGEVRRMLEAA